MGTCLKIDAVADLQKQSEKQADDEYTPFSAVSPEHLNSGSWTHKDPDDNYLDTASRPGPGVLEEGREGEKYLGRGAGTLFVCEDDEVRHAETPLTESRATPRCSFHS